MHLWLLVALFWVWNFFDLTTTEVNNEPPPRYTDDGYYYDENGPHMEPLNPNLDEESQDA